MAGVYDLPSKKERMQKALAEARTRSKQTAEKIRQERALEQTRKETQPPPASITSAIYNEDPKVQSDYLNQKAWRGIGSGVFGIGDIFNTIANAGIRDVDYFTGGGLSGGTYDPYQFGMTSQAAADIAHEATGQPNIDPATIPPEARTLAGRVEGATSAVPIPGPQDIAALLPLLKAAGVVAGKVSPAVLHAVPNLFKKPALEDLAAGVNPDKVWHDWQWETNARGEPWTETTGKPAMNPDVVRPPHASGPLPPRGSDYPKDQSAFQNQDQPSLFTREQAPEVGSANARHRIQMTRDPYGPPPPIKHGWTGGRVSDFVTNPQLYEQPGLEFLGEAPMRLSDQPLREHPGASGLYHYPSEKKPHGEISVRSDKPYTEPSTSNIKVSTPGNPDPLATAQHEINHLAAQHFGLPQGYSSLEPGAAAKGVEVRTQIQNDKDAAEAAFNQRTADFWKQEDDYFDKHGDLKPSDYDESGRVTNPDYKTLSQFKREWALLHPESAQLMEDTQLADALLGKSDPNLAYHTRSGEVSSRNAGRRDTGEYSPQELRYKRPAETEDVPRRFQWDEAQQPGQVVNPKPAAAADEVGPTRKKLAAQIAQGTTKHPVSGIVMKKPLEEVEPVYKQTDKMLPTKPVSFEKFKDRTIIPVLGDPTITGKTLLGVGGEKFEKGVHLPGGPGFMQGPQQIKEGMGWASTEGASTKLENRANKIFEETGKPAIGFYMKQGAHSGDYALHQAQIVHEMYKLNPPPRKVADAFDKAMRTDWKLKRGKSGKPDTYEFPATQDWPGMNNLTDEWLAAHPNDRKKMVKLMDTKEWRDQMGVEVGHARFAGMEKDLVNAEDYSSGYGTIEFDPTRKATTNPKIPHTSYAQQNPAFYTGQTPPIPLDVLYDRYSEGINPGHLYKLLLTRPPSVHVDQKTLDRVMGYLRTQDGTKWGLGGAVAAGVLTEEQARTIKDEHAKGGNNAL